jgi:hypothetical protein
VNLLKTAVKAGIPLIAARTDDPRGFGAVVEEITGMNVVAVKIIPSKVTNTKSTISQFMKPNQLGVMEYDDLDWKSTQEWLEKHESILIVINCPEIHHRMLDVGFVSVPLQLIADFVRERVSEGEPIAKFVSALSGLSLHNIDRISRMATAEFGEFTPKSLRAIRKRFFQVVRGIEEVATEQLFYDPPEILKEWLKMEGILFTANTQPLLTPRGFLFTGLPGTGKTSGAKYLANQLNVPLYRLDLGQVLSKWAGESDQRLSTALKQAESFEPCILLIDEVEKLFETTNGSDILARLLGHLLWWLQEHSSKVLVVMTTNHAHKLPPELYREGRVDQSVNFTGLTNANLLPFMRDLAKKLDYIAAVPTEDLEALATKLRKAATGNGDMAAISQSRVTEQVLRLIKLKIVQQMKGD